MQLPFDDRLQAGRQLAESLSGLTGREHLLVLALPRGGVPVGAEVARALDAPLDLMLVRKLGVPVQPELAMGAIASGGVRVMNWPIVHATGVTQSMIESVARAETAELERRERLYRGGRPPPLIQGRELILVDDGLATGATMRAAVAAAAAQRPAGITVAVPVASAEAVALLMEEADAVVCLATPDPFIGVGRWYRSFPQTDDDEVSGLLRAAWTRSGEPERRAAPGSVGMGSPP